MLKLFYGMVGRLVELWLWLRALFARFPLVRRMRNVGAFAVLLAAAWPVTGYPPTPPITLHITALGEKNPASQGTEVWLNGLPPEISAESVRDAQTPPASWSNKNGLYVSHLAQPATMTWKGSLGSGGRVLLGRHAWSGMAKVEIEGGQSRVVDLYSAGPSEPLAVKVDSLLPPRVFSWSYYFQSLAVQASLLFYPLFLVAYLIGLRSPPARMDLPPAPTQHTPDQARVARHYWRDVLAFAVPSLAIFLVMLMATWPAQMSSDSVGQWHELATGNFTNGHPLIHTLLLGGPGYLAGTPAVSTLLQVVLFAVAIGAVLTEMTRQGLSRPKAWGAAVLLPLFPPVHTLSTVFWKDVPYAIALLGVLWALLVIYRRDSEIVATRAFAIGFAVLLFLAGTFRHNGVLVTAGIVVGLALMARPLLPRRLLSVLAIGGIAAPLALTYLVLPALKVPGVGRHFTGAIPMHALAHAVREDLVSDPEVKTRLAAIMPMEKWRENYLCSNIVPLFFDRSVQYEKVDASLFVPLLKIIAAHPMVMSEHYACITSLLWRVSPTEGAIYGLAPLLMTKTPKSEALGLQFSPVSQSLYDFLVAEFQATTGDPLTFAVFWRPATILYLLLGAVALTWGSMTLPQLLVLTSPILLNTLSQAPLITAQDYRYQFPSVVLALLLMVFLILAKRPIGQNLPKT